MLFSKTLISVNYTFHVSGDEMQNVVLTYLFCCLPSYINTGVGELYESMELYDNLFHYPQHLSPILGFEDKCHKTILHVGRDNSSFSGDKITAELFTFDVNEIFPQQNF